jgi:mannose-6-phosphate isomerase-like protein (cupin superfamily)
MYHEDIKKMAKDNDFFRQVIETGKYSQVVLMALKVGEDIGEETHGNIDQIFFVIDGDGEALVDDETFGIDEHDVVFVPAGTKHNIKNIGNEILKLCTVYSPPAHADGTIHVTKEDAMNE